MIKPRHPNSAIARFPVPELPSMRNDVRAEQDAEFRREFRRRTLAQPVAPTAPAAGGQVAPQLSPATLLGINVAIDGLLADPARGTFIAHPVGDLLGGPARAETTLDLVAQPGIPHQLALPRPSPVRIALRHNAPVAAELRDLAVVEMIAPQLAEDRRAVPAKPARHLVRAQLHLPPAFDLAAFGKRKVREPNLHSYDPFMAQPIVEHRKSHSRIARPRSTARILIIKFMKNIMF